MPNCLFNLNHYSNGLKILTFCTMEKRNVWSGKSLAIVDRLSDGSLMWIKNNICPSMGFWGTPASILAQGEDCPFKTTCYFLKLRKSVIIFKPLSYVPFCFNLSIRSLCQTLWNALDKSKNTALTLRVSSKDL